MGDLAYIILALLGGASALTLLAGPVMWWTRPARRVRRALRRGLGSVPDGEIVGGGAGAAFALEGGVISIAWEAGRWRLDYSLAELLGAEILIDEAVAARVFRGEARLPLERIATQADSVGVRLLFADPRHPDFEIDLWPPAPAERRAIDAATAVREANSWLASIEAILRKAPAPIVRTEPHRPEPLEDDED